MPLTERTGNDKFTARVTNRQLDKLFAFSGDDAVIRRKTSRAVSANRDVAIKSLQNLCAHRGFLNDILSVGYVNRLFVAFFPDRISPNLEKICGLQKVS